MGREAGDRVGRYIIDRRLGQGGMAEAYLAHQEGMAGFKKPVVVKLLHPHHAEDPRNVDQFLREARVGGRLNHANIIQIFDLGEERGQHYIAMEYVDGLTLLQASKRCWAMGQGIPVDVAVRVVSHAALGLHHAHTLKASDGSDAGIVHRDISPDNIMIARDGTVKVLDFGVARIGGAEATSSGDIKGKIPFMPPEQVTGELDVDARADIWALGVTLYWCLSGKRPFTGGNDALLMQAILEQQPASLKSLSSKVSQELSDVVMQCLAKDRAKRVQTAGKLSSTLLKLVPAAQEDPVARFSARMRKLDDDPPERKGPRSTGGWQAVALPAVAEEDDSNIVTDPPLPDMTSQVRSVPGLEKTTVAPPPPSSSSVFAPRSETPFDGGARAETPFDNAVGSDDNDLGNLGSTVALADVTVEDMQRPGVATLEEPSEVIPSTVRFPAMRSLARRPQLALIIIAAAASLLAFIVIVVVVAYGTRRVASPAPSPSAPSSSSSGAARAGAPAEPAAGPAAPPPPRASPASAPPAATATATATTATSSPPDAASAAPEAAAAARAPLEPALSSRPDERPKAAQREAGTSLFVVGPPHIKWLTLSGKALGEGTRNITVPEGEKSIVAFDTQREGRTAVAVTERIDYARLPTGTLLIKVTPYATNVMLGKERLGPTPLGAVDVVAGTYKLVVENNRNVVTRTIKVAPGVENVVTVEAPLK